MKGLGKDNNGNLRNNIQIFIQYIECVCWISYDRVISCSKKIKWGKKFCLYFIVWLINSLLYVFSTGIIVVRISIIIGYLCFAFILYEGSWKMKILATVGAFALGLISEDVVWIFSNLIGKPIEEEAMGVFVLWNICVTSTFIT